MYTLNLTNELPQSVRAVLWSYDTSRMDIEHDKKRIITNVLVYGTEEAVDWVFATYPKDDIRAIVKHPRPGEWDKKSLNYWSIMLEVTPTSRTRF